MTVRPKQGPGRPAARTWDALALLVALAACNGKQAPPGALPSGGHDEPTQTAELPAPIAPPSSSPIAPAPPSPPRPFVVAAIGDSLTDARSGGGGYLDHLRQHCPQSSFHNFGVGGDMVNQMRRRLLRDVWAPGHPDYTHLIVFGGVNDLYSDLTAGRRPANIGVDLAWMYAEARRRGVRVVAVTVTPWGGFKRYFNATRQAATLELNRWIEAQRRSNVIDHAVDAYSLLSCDEPERLCPELARPFEDGLHFGPLGHQKLGQALVEQVFAGCV